MAGAGQRSSSLLRAFTMNVFVTAGTQFPFKRLDEVVSKLSADYPDWSIVYQSGPGSDLDMLAGLSLAQVKEFFTPKEFKAYFDAADLVITHAGMGNIITCLEEGKLFVMFPRLSKYGEHRNDHQVDSAHAISKIYSTPVFFTVSELISYIPQSISPSSNSAWPKNELLVQRKRFGENLNDLLLSFESQL